MTTTEPTINAPVRLGKLGEDRVLKPRPIDKLIIVGMGLTAIQFINHCFEFGYANKDEKTEIWAINNAAHAFNCDMCWSIHDDRMMHLEQFSRGGKPYLNDLKCPIVLAEALADYPNSLEYPLHEVWKEFQETYFNNTTAYMIAFAMLCGVKQIYMFGTDYNYGGHTVFENGRPCTEYWLGRARERGVEIYVPPNGMLLDVMARKSQGIYGYTLQPIATFGDDGRVNGISHFVDPYEYRMNMSIINGVIEKAQLLGTDEEKRAQAEQIVTLMGRMFNMPEVTLLALLTGNAEVRAVKKPEFE